jgi:hypothetical protein
VGVGRGGLGSERVVRLETAIFISSGSTTTPVHFDPEVNFFSQIEGQKFYHVYPPVCAQETELERFYIRGRVGIGQVDLMKLDASREHVYVLEPGKGFHQRRILRTGCRRVRSGRCRSVLSMKRTLRGSEDGRGLSTAFCGKRALRRGRLASGPARTRARQR